MNTDGLVSTGTIVLPSTMMKPIVHERRNSCRVGSEFLFFCWEVWGAGFGGSTHTIGPMGPCAGGANVGPTCLYLACYTAGGGMSSRRYIKFATAIDTIPPHHHVRRGFFNYNTFVGKKNLCAWYNQRHTRYIYLASMCVVGACAHTRFSRDCGGCTRESGYTIARASGGVRLRA